MKKKCINKEVGKNNQSQLKTPGCNVKGEGKYRQSSEKNKEKRSAQSQRSKLAADAT